MRINTLAVWSLIAISGIAPMLGHAASKVGFIEAPTFGTGDYPYGAVVGDFNNDGNPDIAVANTGESLVRVLINKGDGTFAPPVSYAVSGTSVYVVAGDFNGDGKLDLATPGSSTNSVSVLLGNGDGTFAPAVDYPAGSTPSGIVLADFNGDGKLDVAVTNQNSNQVSVLLGNGDGTFQAPISSSALAQPLLPVVGDFNGDGKPDLAMLEGGFSSNEYDVLLGNGDGTFRKLNPVSVGTSPQYLTVADMNGDGEADLVVGDFATGVIVLDGNGDGTFGKGITYPVRGDVLWLAIGDFNGDGQPDVVAATNGEGVGVLLSQSNHRLQPAIYYTAGQSPRSVVTADFNGDGSLDLAVADIGSQDKFITSGYFTVLYGTGGGDFRSPEGYFVGSDPNIVVGDFNGDGKPDIAAANYKTRDVSIQLNLGNGKFASALHNSVLGPNSVAVGDFNEDGKLDLAVTTVNLPTASVSFMFGNGDGTFQAPVSYAVAAVPEAVAVGDFNNDGHLDVATVIDNCGPISCPEGLVTVLLGDGHGSFQSAGSFGTGGLGPLAIVTADFNNDGNLDLAVTNHESDSVGVLLGKGDGTFTFAGTSPTEAFPQTLAAADFNGDGKLDIAVGNSCQPCQLTILTGNGDGTFKSTSTGFYEYFFPWQLALADFNGDGKPDIAMSGEGFVYLLLNQGNGSFGSPLSFAGGSGALALADFNGDGSPDAVVGDSQGSNITVLLGLPR